MEKPNHSNGKETQNYDPATGKYLKDSSASKPLADDDFDFGAPESPEQAKERRRNELADMRKRALDNAEQIRKAEASLGDRRKAVMAKYGDLMDLDERRVMSATDEEIDAFLDAMAQKRANDALGMERGLERSAARMYGNEFEAISDGIKVEDFPSISESVLSGIRKKDPYSAIQMPKAYGYWKEHSDAADRLSIEDTWSDAIARFQNPNSLYSVERKKKAFYAKTDNESEEVLSPWARKCANAMMPDEQDAIRAYTGIAYKSINAPLYGNESEHSASKSKTLLEAKRITSALDKCATDRDMWVERSVDAGMRFGDATLGDLISHPEDYVGMSFKNHAFMSCSAAKGTSFAGKQITMNVYLPRGTKAAYIMGLSVEGKSENEMLINRGYTYIIRGIEGKGFGQATIDIELRLGSDRDRMSDDQMKERYGRYL